MPSPTVWAGLHSRSVCHDVLAFKCCVSAPSAPTLVAVGHLQHLSAALRRVLQVRAYPPWLPENTVQISLTFNHPKSNDAPQLCVRDSAGAVRQASRGEILEAARSAILEALQLGQAMTAPNTVRDFLRLRLNGSLQREVFAVLFLDSQNQLIAFEEPFLGTIDSAAVYPREIVRAALMHNAAAVILAHNHPSGNAIPSKADIQLTIQLRDALALIGTRVLDHMIVGGAEVSSMAEKGLI